VDDIYQKDSKNLDDVINNHMSLTNLENDKLFEMFENTVKRVIFYVASQKAEKKSEDAKIDTNLTRDQISKLIGLFDELIDVGLIELEEVEMNNNPFYLSSVDKKINTIKNNNADHLKY